MESQNSIGILTFVLLLNYECIFEFIRYRVGLDVFNYDQILANYVAIV